jgi:DNA-binding CsgD family transcriptional regulator
MPYRRVPARTSRPDPFAAHKRLTPRDRLLLSWLAEHYLLSTGQIARALFGSPKTAQMRLTILHRLDVLSRFTYADPAGGTQPFLYALGPVGLRLHPTAYHDPDNPKARPARSSRDRLDRIAASPTLAHLLGINEFFTDVHAHTRTHPDAKLVRWWSEQHATAVYSRAGIRPDGHGVYTAERRTVGFFLEYDNSTEDLARLVGKLAAYERLAHTGPIFPVLFWVPTARRARNVLAAFADSRLLTPVAVGVHGREPATAVWRLATDPDRLLRLDELPSTSDPASTDEPSSSQWF